MSNQNIKNMQVLEVEQPRSYKILKWGLILKLAIGFIVAVYLSIQIANGNYGDLGERESSRIVSRVIFSAAGIPLIVYFIMKFKNPTAINIVIFIAMSISITSGSFISAIFYFILFIATMNKNFSGYVKSL